MKFQFHVQFPVDYFSHPVESILIFPLRQFATFANDMMNHFISIISWPTLSLLLYLIYFCFNTVGPFSVVSAAVWIDSVSCLKCPFLDHVLIFSFVISSVCLLKYTYNCFSFHFCFLVIVVLVLFMLFRVAVIIFYVVSSHRNDTSKLSSMLVYSSPFFSWNIYTVYVLSRV